MTNEIISTLSYSIASIQLKLSDFGMEKIEFEKILTERLQNPETPRNVNKTLNLLEDNHLEYVNQICHYCRSKNVIKHEYRERNPVMGEFGRVKVHVRRYKCKSCGRKFTTRLDPIIKPRHRYSNIFMDKLKLFIETGYRSLRKAAADFGTFFGVSPSHTSIRNWQTKDLGNRIENIDAPYSGYYSYDEQWIKLDAQRYYRLTLYDYILNIPVAEEITPDKEYDTIKRFIEVTTKNKELYSLTTDGLLEYIGITDELGVIHQQCIFHLLKMIKKEIYPILKSEKVSNKEKMELRYYFHEIRHIFDTYVEEIAIQRLERLLPKFNQIPKVLQKFIKEKIVPDFQRLTQYTRNPNIPRTTNCNENYYRQTLPDELKRIFKTPNGISNHLQRKMENWTGKHIKNIDTQ